MNTIILDSENISDYEAYIPEDIAENIGRTYYRGIVIEQENSPVAGMIWEIRNAEKEDAENHICWLQTNDEEAGRELFDAYKDNIIPDGITKTSFSLPAKTSKIEKSVLKEAGFSVALMEGDQIVAKLSEIAKIPVFGKIKENEGIIPLRSITQRGFNVAIRRFAAQGYSGRCADLEYLSRSYFENDISCFSEQEESINGLFLCHMSPSGKIVIEMMAATGSNYQMIILQMIAKALKSAVEIYPPETEVMIDRHNYSSLALGEKLFPRGFGIPVYIGSRAE